MQDAPGAECCGHPPSGRSHCSITAHLVELSRISRACLVGPGIDPQVSPRTAGGGHPAPPASNQDGSVCRPPGGGVPATVVALHCCQEPLCQRLLRPASCMPIGQERLTDAWRPHLYSRGEGAFGRSLIQAKPSLACTAGWKASCATCTSRTAQLRSRAGSSAVRRCFSRLNVMHAHPHEACRALALKVACTGKSRAVVSTCEYRHFCGACQAAAFCESGLVSAHDGVDARLLRTTDHRVRDASCWPS